MTMVQHKGGSILLLFALELVAMTTAFAGPGDRRPAPQRGQVIDDRHHHGHYYPPRGARVRTLPYGYRPYFFRGRPYYFHGGVWYAPGPRGFLVVGAPIGLNVATLPPYYTTLWIDGRPYYYADDTYYQW